MQIWTKMLTASILSVLIGVGFAAPLFYLDAVRPYPTNPPQGPIANVNVDVAYADIRVQPIEPGTVLPNWTRPGNTYYNLTYTLVLNVTNNDDKAAIVDMLTFCAAKNHSDVVSFIGNGIYSTGWLAKGAWVDGVWYNVTVINGITVYPKFNFTGTLSSPDNYDASQPSYNKTAPWFVPYLQEGVHIFDIYTNGTLARTYLDMNGTWADVTGRITVTRPESSGLSPFANGMMLYPVVAESRNFIALGTYRGSVTDTVFGYSANTHTFIGSGTFSNIWAPHETRLILLTGSRIVASSAIDTLNSGTMLVQAQVYHSLANSVINGTRMDTHATNSTLKLIPLGINGDEYLYNTVLSPNEMFVPDQFGVQVTVEPRR